MKNKIIIGNQKMLMSFCDVKDFISNFRYKDNVIICPTNIFIPYFIKNGYCVGIQDVCSEKLGPYTGEVSAQQAKSLGISVSIIGHSERKQSFNETNEIINRKVKESLSNNLKVVLCVGETLEQHNNNETKQELKKQIQECLKNITIDDNVIIAYEPIWSIGTGNTLTNDEIEEISSFIKNMVKTKVLYGGSINENNIENICKINNIDGILVGKLSTDYIKFSKIIEVVIA